MNTTNEAFSKSVIWIYTTHRWSRESKRRKEVITHIHRSKFNPPTHLIIIQWRRFKSKWMPDQRVQVLAKWTVQTADEWSKKSLRNGRKTTHPLDALVPRGSPMDRRQIGDRNDVLMSATSLFILNERILDLIAMERTLRDQSWYYFRIERQWNIIEVAMFITQIEWSWIVAGHAARLLPFFAGSIIAGCR